MRRRDALLSARSYLTILLGSCSVLPLWCGLRNKCLRVWKAAAALRSVKISSTACDTRTDL